MMLIITFAPHLGISFYSGIRVCNYDPENRCDLKNRITLHEGKEENCCLPLDK